jgi:hypothetical protein
MHEDRSTQTPNPNPQAVTHPQRQSPLDFAFFYPVMHKTRSTLQNLQIFTSIGRREASTPVRTDTQPLRYHQKQYRKRTRFVRVEVKFLVIVL